MTTLLQLLLLVLRAPMVMLARLPVEIHRPRGIEVPLLLELEKEDIHHLVLFQVLNQIILVPLLRINHLLWFEDLLLMQSKIKNHMEWEVSLDADRAIRKCPSPILL